MDIETLKQRSAKAAALLVEEKMTVGLGSGSTASYFINYLIERANKEGLSIQAVASSNSSAILAKQGGIVVLDIDEVDRIDLTVDGADEITPLKHMIKGGGGALLREKIVANLSQELVIIIDETKQVSGFGKHKLPIEVIPFGSKHTLKKIESFGVKAVFRKSNQDFFVTDNHNYIIDVYFSKKLDNPQEFDAAIRQIPGVVETGFFFNLADKVITSYQDGRTTIT